MQQRGYTLIELMVVLATIAILVLFASVSYKDYVIKTRVSEGLALASTPKMAIDDYIYQNGVLPPNQAATGYTGTTPTVNVSTIQIADDGTGEIIIHYTAAAGNGSIILKPTILNERVTWSCVGGSLEMQYRPASCR